MNNQKNKLNKTDGKLGVLIVGLNGAVSTTFLAGIYSVIKGISKPIGSISQMGTIRLGNRKDNNFPLIKNIVPLTEINDLVFGGWDIRDENCYEAANYAKVLKENDIEKVKNELAELKPMRGVFDRNYIKNLKGDFIKENGSKYDKMMMLREDIKKFKTENSLERVIVIWCASTEVYLPQNGIHYSIDKLVMAMQGDHPDVSPSMLYAWAAISEGCPFINGAPNLSCEIPAIVDYSMIKNVPIAGKDFKTGQTLVKTVISPMLKAKMLGLKGWFSTNILGNRDGEVLDDPDSFKTKEESKLSVLKNILQPDLYPDLYSEYYHKVRINYYPPRGDDKEGWDNIDIFGWMGYPMQIKIDFLCKDSILAAPLVLDLTLFMDFAQRMGYKGIQDWLSFYFKSPIHDKNNIPEHDLFIQQMKLKNTLRKAMGYEVVSHLDYEYENAK